MATVGEHPNVINLIAACTETGIFQFNFQPGHRCKVIKFYEHIATLNFVMAKHALKTCLWWSVPFKLHANRRNDSQHCRPTILRVVASILVHVAKRLTGFKLHNNSKQHARTCTNMQQLVQTEVTCNVAKMMGFFGQKCCVRLHGAWNYCYWKKICENRAISTRSMMWLK